MDIPFLAGLPYADWNYSLAPQKNGGCPAGPEERCPCSRAKVMGGCTVHNTMSYMRGNRMDYNTWAALGNGGWDYESVLPYFKKTENVQIPELKDSEYHGTSGNIMNTHPYETNFTKYAMETAQLLGIPTVDYNGANQTGISRLQATIYKGTRWSANRVYLLGLRRPNLFVRKRALVFKVIIQNGTAVGVDYIQNNETHRVFAKKEVILSTGAINSPQLLMLSGIGPKEHLEELDIPTIVNSPVGRILFDHPLFQGLIIKVDEFITPSRYDILSDFSNFVQYIVNNSGPLSGNGVEVFQHLEVGEEAINSSWPNILTAVLTQPNVLTREIAQVLGFTEEFFEQFSAPIAKDAVFEPIVVLIRPRSKGTLTLQDSNIYSHPIIDPNYFSDPEDVAVIVEGIKRTKEFYTSGPFRQLGAQVYNASIPACAGHAFDTDEYWSCAARWASVSMSHLSGTCRMGVRDDPTAVVSPHLTVWGVEGLRVVDASIFPTLPSSPIQAVVYMVAEKASDLIKCTYKEGGECPSR
ncbi:hypothetical protein R5R35_011210 [Gryllus longicercus]|uniref:Glucose-methanol-choline oxidoreductase N-terminal domain-containing protein n=1 Tax=Gryllus longicercus TaxID=2509291 RepID=A0AAN9VRT4_9ORTH